VQAQAIAAESGMIGLRAQVAALVLFDGALGPGAAVLADVSDVGEVLGDGLGLARLHRLVAAGTDHHGQFLLKGGDHLLDPHWLLGAIAHAPGAKHRHEGPLAKPPCPAGAGYLRSWSLGGPRPCRLAEKNKRRQSDADDGRTECCELPAIQVAQRRQRLIRLDAHDFYPHAAEPFSDPRVQCFGTGVFEFGWMEQNRSNTVDFSGTVTVSQQIATLGLAGR
jgi:hypothetical protein